MTNLIITFVSSGVIKLTTTATIFYKIEKFNSDKTLIEIVESTELDGTNIDITLTDGFYKVSNISDGVSETVLIYKAVIDKLEEKVKDILLNGVIQPLYSTNYDFVLLSLISILVLGNNTYQIVAYNVANLDNYAQLALTISKCTKYLDLLNNTQQSTNGLI